MPKKIETGEGIEITTDGEENVEVTKDQLASVLKTIEEQSKQIKILEKSVSRSRLEQAQAASGDGKDMRPRGFLKHLHGHLIVGWKNASESPIVAENKIIFQNNVPVGEIMRGEYITIDGKTLVADYVEFVRSNDLEYFRVIEDNGETIIIEFENKDLPQSYEIKKKFINP